MVFAWKSNKHLYIHPYIHANSHIYNINKIDVDASVVQKLVNFEIGDTSLIVTEESSDDTGDCNDMGEDKYQLEQIWG